MRSPHSCPRRRTSVTTSPPAPIVDAHHRFAEGPPQRSPADLAPLLAEHGVASTVLLQPIASDEQTDRAVALAAETGFVAAVVPWVDVTAPSLAGRLDALGQSPKLRGVCVLASAEVDNRWLVRDDVLAGLGMVAERGLSLDVLAEPRNLPSVGELAARLPNLPIAVAHLGGPSIDWGQREPWGVYLLNLASRRNVVMKLSGLVRLDARPWNVAHIRGFVEHVVRLFGYDRLMFGSDWPDHGDVATYAQVMESAVAAAEPMTGAQREQLLAGTAREFYRIG